MVSLINDCWFYKLRIKNEKLKIDFFKSFFILHYSFFISFSKSSANPVRFQTVYCLFGNGPKRALTSP